MAYEFGRISRMGQQDKMNRDGKGGAAITKILTDHAAVQACLSPDYLRMALVPSVSPLAAVWIN